MSIIDRNNHRKVNVEPQHTLTPWRIGNDSHSKVYDKKGLFISAIAGDDEAQAEANAAFIVRAVNSHETLLDALRGLTKEINLGKLSIRKDFPLINAHAYALKIIAQAEGRE